MTMLIRNFKFATFLLWTLSFLAKLHATEQTSKRIHIDNGSKIVLGGLFPVHSKGTGEGGRCGRLFKEKGIQRLEAMLYALDQINNDPVNWPFKFGATILDTCTSDLYALEQSLQFLHHCSGQNANINRKVIAVVGASNSDVSESLANIFKQFQIPQVSYASSSKELEDMYKYPYFFRVGPSDRFQVKVIVDILLKMNWTYVSVVAAKGEYGEKAAGNLQSLIEKSSHKIFISTIEILKRDAREEDYYLTIHRFDSHDNARVVIVLLNEDKIGSNIPENRFLWLGSDGWGAKQQVSKGRELWAKDSITILPKRFPIQGFDDYFLSLKPSTNTRNPWFEEYWENQFNCNVKKRKKEEIKKNCTGNEDLRPLYSQEGLVPMVIDSVYLLATSIRTLMCPDYPNSCKNPEIPEEQHRIKLVEIISNVSMNSSQGNEMVISFDKYRNVPVNYTIYQYKETMENTFVYEPIGEWSILKRLSLWKSPTWSFSEKTDASGNPISSCSVECKPGQERTRISEQIKVRDCWTCRYCDINNYLPALDERCTGCPIGKLLNLNKTDCIDIDPDYLGKDMGNPWAVVPLVFSVIGLIITCFVFVIFFLYHKTPLIKASGREQCYMILIGIVLCYFFTFIVLCKPTKITCGILRIGMGLGLSVCYSAIFTKTNRIFRIFEVSLKIAKRPSYLSPRSQINICAFLVLIQVTLTVLWLFFNPPDISMLMLQHPKKFVEICNLDVISVILGLLYNMVLLVLCSIYTYKTRYIPGNFNESKWIGFIFCFVWLIFIAFYFSSLEDYKVQSTILSMSVSVSGTVTLVCIFFPKVYIVIFHPEKNVRYRGQLQTLEFREQAHVTVSNFLNTV